MKPDFKKWLLENNRNVEGILISSFMPTTNTWGIFNQFAEEYADKELNELREFAIWLTGCGYDFTQHEYFIKNRHLLAGNDSSSQKFKEDEKGS